ncbi:Mor transcription activator family protein [Vibrio parahaemolyticus]|uniref:Mor transcription activator family protein n=1 Tax=Vibrio parahaemolyticus TaxID=670 RepID=UPI003891233F
MEDFVIMMNDMPIDLFIEQYLSTYSKMNALYQQLKTSLCEQGVDSSFALNQMKNIYQNRKGLRVYIGSLDSQIKWFSIWNNQIPKPRYITTNTINKLNSVCHNDVDNIYDIIAVDNFCPFLFSKESRKTYELLKNGLGEAVHNRGLIALNQMISLEQQLKGGHANRRGIYIPFGRSILEARFRQKILSEYGKLSTHQLAKKYGYTERGIYRIIKENNDR